MSCKPYAIVLKLLYFWSKLN